MDTLQTYERLIPIVNTIDKNVTCQSVTDNLDGTYTFLSKYTSYAVAGHTVTIGLVSYKITNVVCNTSITVSGASLPLQLTFDLYDIVFKHGTVKKIAEELNKMQGSTDRVPLIALIETVEEGLHFNTEDAIDVDADCRLLFLTSADVKNWTQIDGDTKATRPMRNLVRQFIEALTKSQYVAEMESVGRVRNYNIVGNQDANGTVKNLFNEPLNGVELRVTIPFLKGCDCCNIPQLDLRCAPGYVYNSIGDLLAILYSNDVYEVVGAGGIVTIIDQNNNEIDTVEAPGEYQVTVLTEIRDTINDNTTTIVEYLN